MVQAVFLSDTEIHDVLSTSTLPRLDTSDRRTSSLTAFLADKRGEWGTGRVSFYAH